MSDSQNKSVLQRFNGLPSGTRTAIIGGSFVASMFVAGTIMTSADDAQKRSDSPVQKDNLIIHNPGNSNATEAVAANLEDARKQITQQQSKIALLEESAKQAQARGADGQWNDIANLTAQIQALQERVNGMSSPAALPLPAPAKGKDSASRPTPQADAQGADLSSAALPGAPGASAAPTASSSIQVVGGDKKPAKASASKKEEPAAYVPSGSNFEAVLLNGMDASTSIGANRNPTPALLRIKTDAILPNLFSFNVRECFVMVGGFGNMSTERVEMRTESMSCIAENGEVYEGKIEGFLVGEDGKAGARGRVVSKQGALLAKSFMAGFVGGLGGAFAPQPVPSLSLNGGSTQSYQFPNPEQVVGSGMATGLSRSSQALANFYIKLAEQMFPVVELDAGRKMTVILLKGVELKMEKKG